MFNDLKFKEFKQNIYYCGLKEENLRRMFESFNFSFRSKIFIIDISLFQNFKYIKCQPNLN